MKLHLVSNLLHRKRLLFIVTLLLFSIFAFGNNWFSSAQDKEQPVVTVDTQYEERRGRTVNINVAIEDAEDIAGGQLELHFDPNVVTVRSVKQGDALTQFPYFESNHQDGIIQAAWASAEEIGVDGNILEVEFRLSENNGQTELALADVQLFNEQIDQLSATTFDGQIKPFDGITEVKKSKVAKNKPWTISFNQPVHPSTVSARSLYVLDDRGNKVPTERKLSHDRKSIEVTPVGGYASGEYTLWVTEQVGSSVGKGLHESVKMEFTVN